MVIFCINRITLNQDNQQSMNFHKREKNLIFEAIAVTNLMNCKSWKESSKLLNTPVSLTAVNFDDSNVFSWLVFFLVLLYFSYFSNEEKAQFSIFKGSNFTCFHRWIEKYCYIGRVYFSRVRLPSVLAQEAESQKIKD